MSCRIALGRPGDQLVEVENARRELGPAAEREEVPGQGRGAVGRLADLGEVVARLDSGSELSSSSSATWPRMPVSRLLKSCAMPPASWTISRSGPARASRSSSARRSVTSVVQPL